jgi:hypothetical protein
MAFDGPATTPLLQVAWPSMLFPAVPPPIVT